MVLRIIMALLGCVSIYTGIFGALNFDPPLYADPGAINACWLTFILMIVVGHVFILSSVWKIGGAK